MSDLFPPVEHQSLKSGRRFQRLRAIPFRIVAPNLVTLLALCAGLTAIRMALEQRWEWAVAAVVLAAILDAVDGRVARWVKGTSKFGAELDSLADFVNFGVVPGLLLYTWILDRVPGPGWLAVLTFAIAAALRLARFNVMLEKPKPDWQANYFTGMPAPAGALSVLLPIYLADWVPFPHTPFAAVLIAAYTLFIAFMMVSTIPTYSGKKVGTRVPREYVIPLSAMLVLLVAVLVTYPFATLTLAIVAYLAFIPVGWRRFHRLERADRAAAETAQAATPEKDAGGQA